MDSEGKLYVVGTPIGNLDDITFRAVRVLQEADVVLAEDTRVTKKLLDHYRITTKLMRCDALVEHEKVDEVLTMLEDDKDVALVSDAGTPGVSDPGARLVHAVRDAGYEVIVVPGPSAVTAALSVAGVMADNFMFLGYPPHKKGRKTFFEQFGNLLAGDERTVIFFESPHRIMKTFQALKDLFSSSAELENRKIVLARELTKIHEEVLEGTPQEIIEALESDSKKQKGEFVIICSPETKSN